MDDNKKKKVHDSKGHNLFLRVVRFFPVLSCTKQEGRIRSHTQQCLLSRVLRDLISPTCPRAGLRSPPGWTPPVGF